MAGQETAERTCGGCVVSVSMYIQRAVSLRTCASHLFLRRGGRVSVPRAMQSGCKKYPPYVLLSRSAGPLPPLSPSPASSARTPLGNCCCLEAPLRTGEACHPERRGGRGFPVRLRVLLSCVGVSIADLFADAAVWSLLPQLWCERFSSLVFSRPTRSTFSANHAISARNAPDRNILWWILELPKNN